jgi:hypothetical protein
VALYRQSVGLFGRVVSPVARPLPTQDTEETRTDIHCLVGFEPTILVFERANTFYVIDRAATVIGAVVSLEVKPFCAYHISHAKYVAYGSWAA